MAKNGNLLVRELLRGIDHELQVIGEDVPEDLADEMAAAQGRRRCL